MTTLTVEIDKKEDLSHLTEYITRLGLKYEVEEEDKLVYTDDVKKMLDERYEDYTNGVNMVSEAESQQEIRDLLDSKK